MNRAFLNLTLLFFHLCSFKLFAAAHGATYRSNPPIFYAALAEAAYETSTFGADLRVRKLLGRTARVNVLSRKVYRSLIFGNTNFILATDLAGNLHVAIEGSDKPSLLQPFTLRNWIANAYMPIQGTVTGYDVPRGTRKAMHNMIKHWEKKHGMPIVSISGHSQGGAYASQMVHWRHKHYEKTGTQVITFNCYKPKKADNQLHFLVTKEHFASLFSSSGRYIKIDKSGKDTSILSNHGMKYFFRAFKGKSWMDVS